MLTKKLFIVFAATLIFFVIYGLLRACIFQAVIFINSHQNIASGVLFWMLPIIASAVAATISTSLAIKVIKNIFNDIPKRYVANAIIFFWVVTSLITLVGALVTILMLHEFSWNDVRDDVGFTVGALISCIYIKDELWPGKKSSS